MPTAYGGDPSQTYLIYMPRWRGFDNPFGDIWTDVDGCISDSANNTFYIITDTNNYTDSLDNIDSLYSRKYTIPSTNAYITTFHIGDDADIVPETVGGSSTTYKCDYYYTTSDSGARRLLLGGNANHSSAAGLGFFHVNNAVSWTNTAVGFRTVNVIE